MKTRKIVNIVFYNFYENEKEIRQACLFYNDGTVENCSFDEGIDHTLELLREQKITSSELSSIINNKNIHVMSGKEFINSLQKFIVKEEDPAFEEINLEQEATAPNEEIIETPEDLIDEENEDENKDQEDEKHDEEQDDIEDNYDSLAHTEYEDEDEENIIDSEEIEESSSNESKKKKSRFVTKVTNFFNRNNIFAERPLKVADEVSTNSKRKNSRFAKVKNFFHKTRVKVAAVTLSVLVALTGGLIIGKNEGKINKFLNNAISKDSTNKNNNTSNNNLVYGDNDYYDNYSYVDLLKVNTNNAQKGAMQKIRWAFTRFNKIFANSHIEEGKNIKAALSWTEMNSLQQAYNEYSTEDIKAIFNGSVIKANEFSQAYKNANLQLMGAHVIETRQNPVDLSVLINSEEGKTFYRKYHEMFLQIKEAEGQDKIDKVNAWRQSLLEDFPISDEIREIGIAHSDSRLIEPYKLSIVPMASAVEIMYQNLATDNTLSEKTINYFNDTGLCNLADDTFERIERITEVATENNAEPLYIQYENAITSELEAENNYNIDDADRELTQLDAFQAAVNEHNHIGLDESYSSSINGGNITEIYTTTETNTVTTTDKKEKKEKTSTSDRKEAIKKSSKKAVKEAEDKVNKQIAKDNEEAKKQAETLAEETRKQKQSEADEQAKQIEEQIAQDDQDLQNDIEDANDQIAQNNSDTDTTNDKPVNEQDFGDHNVDFDNNHSDENGNLDNSVKDLTTDSTNDQSSEPLPDPNATGETFEQSYPKESVDPEYVPQAQTPVETYTYQEDNSISDQSDSIITYEEPVVETIEYAEIPEGISNEELADMIVEDMANNPETEYNEGYEYVLR